MFCEKCGTKLEEGSLFCENCGTKIVVEKANEIPPVEINYQQAPQQGNQPVYTNYQQVPPVAQQIPRVPKEPMKKSTKAFILEVLILAVLLVAVFLIGKNRFGDAFIAENYAKAKIAGDWNSVYDMLYLPQSSLLTEEMFLMTRASDEQLEIVNYDLEKRTDSSNNFKSSFRCEYMTSGDHYSNSETIELVKQREKQLLLFDKWEVMSGEFLAENVSVYAPTGAVVKLNGVDVTTLKDVETENEYGNTRYMLPDLFVGTYVVEVEAEGRCKLCQEVELYNGTTRYFTDMQPDLTVVEDLAVKGKELYSAMWSSWAEGKQYDAFLQENSANLVDEIDFREYYESWLNRLTDNEEYKYTDISFKELQSRVYDYGYNSETGNFFIKFNISGQIYCKGTRAWENWWTGEISVEPYEENSYYNGYYTYMLVNNEWVISYIGF